MPSSGPPPLPPVPADGDTNRGETLNGVIWFFAAITTVVYICRLYSRKFLTRNLGLEDAILSVGVALLYVQCAMVSVSVHYGLARHTYYILTMSNPLDVANVVKWQAYSEPIAIFGGTIPKIAVTLLVIRLLNPHKLVVAYLWTLNIVLNVISIVCVITTFIQCSPTSFYWTRTGNGTCWDPSIVANLAITQGSISAFTDFTLSLFPVTVLWSLQMPLQRKLAVIILLGFGSIAGAAAIIRTTKLSRLAETQDITWSFWTLVLWVAVECCIVIICACIPCLRPLVNKLIGDSFSSTFVGLFSRSRGKKHTDTSGGISFVLRSSGESKLVKIEAGSINSYGSRSNLSNSEMAGIRATTDVQVMYHAQP